MRTPVKIFRTAIVLACVFGITRSAQAEDQYNMMKSLDQYIKEAKANQPPLQSAQGSLYFSNGINSELFTDLKARRVNDIVTVLIQEDTQAQSTANAQTSRKSAVELGIPNFFGLEDHVGDFNMKRLVTADTDMQFKGDGATARRGSVDAFLSTRVREVLPNGDMVIEGAKEVKVNNERQMVRLFGVVRLRDIGPNNIVLSNAIANMLVQVDGKGVLSNSIRQGWLFTIFEKVWPF